MIRLKPKPKKYVNSIAVFPLLFWKTCCLCDLQFLREKGWLHRTTKYDNDIMYSWTFKQYVCQHCASTAEQADAKVIAKRDAKRKTDYEYARQIVRNTKAPPKKP